MLLLEKDSFNFNKITRVKVTKSIKQLNLPKYSQSDYISTKIVKERGDDHFAKVIANDFNKCLHNGFFSKETKNCRSNISLRKK